ncbi:calpain-8-like [Garra rufa]|uniref:calpain-8-like n=1 Tax=Garra rufa TaxID=137080 RepID=UPI003CCE6BE1
MALPVKCLDVHDAGTLTNPSKFMGQDYQQLLQQSLSSNQLYTDELFPPNNSSIGDMCHKQNKIDWSKVVWKRPSELVTNPCFVVDGVSRFDYKQGHLGNCWFLAPVGALTFQKEVTNQVFPSEQSFSNNYAGIFHFKFWRFGEWIDVVIDDLLPTFNEKLFFVHPKTSNEFWPALLEKAYAKVCGSYADLEAGRRSEAMLDFTGGVHLHFVLDEAPAYLWSIMDRAARARSLICSGTHKEEPQKLLPSSGLVSGHAYTVTGVSRVISNRHPVKLVRLLNPWGRKEWTGDWSDKSPLWDTICGEEKKKCHEDLDNGEFWMSMEDYTKFFKSMDICCVSPDFLERSPVFHWKSLCSTGEWTESTAGGSMKELDTFWRNPQYRVRIEELHEDCPHKDDENIVVSLIQNHKTRHRKDQTHYNIGFYVFALGSTSKSSPQPISEVSVVTVFQGKKPETFSLRKGIEPLSTFCQNQMWKKAGGILRHTPYFRGSRDLMVGESDCNPKVAGMNDFKGYNFVVESRPMPIQKKPWTEILSLERDHQSLQKYQEKSGDPVNCEPVKGEQGKPFDRTKPVAEFFAYRREVMKFLRLEPGEYLIVPCTENPGETASFVLSIFSKHEALFVTAIETVVCKFREVWVKSAAFEHYIPFCILLFPHLNLNLLLDPACSRGCPNSVLEGRCSTLAPVA